MTTVTAKKVTAENEVLDVELGLFTETELEKLADYAKYLVWSREDDNDDWADAPLTPEEEAQIEEGRKEYERGEYLTLDEFLSAIYEELQCGQ